MNKNIETAKQLFDKLNNEKLKNRKHVLKNSIQCHVLKNYIYNNNNDTIEYLKDLRKWYKEAYVSNSHECLTQLNYALDIIKELDTRFYNLVKNI